MDATLEFIISFITICVIGYSSFKQFYQAKKIGLLNLLIGPYFVFLLWFNLHLGVLSKLTSFFPTELIGSSLIGAQLSWVSLLIFAVIHRPSDRQIKTLVRLPIIGFLVGWYLTDYLYFVALALELLGLGLLYYYRESHRYLWRVQLKVSVWVPVFAGIVLGGIYIQSSILIFLLLGLALKLPAINALVLKKISLRWGDGNDI